MSDSADNNQAQTEKEFLESYDIRKFDVPLATVDMAIFTIRDEALQVLLVKRAQHPAKGKWALPGGFIDFQQDKQLADTARRKLHEKTGVDTPYLEQVETFGDGKRDPRGWSLTVVYLALIASEDIALSKNEASEDVRWVPVNKVGDIPLAFDHSQILQVCQERLRAKVQYTSLPVNLLPQEFTLSELQHTFEIILGKDLEKKSFRRRMADADILEETGNMRTGSNRPAKLYKVKKDRENHFFTRIIEGVRDT